MSDASFLNEAERQLDVAVVHRDARIGPLPSWVKWPRLRRKVARLTGSYTGRQALFDEALMVAFASLLEECRDMGTRIAVIEGRESETEA